MLEIYLFMGDSIYIYMKTIEKQINPKLMESQH